MSNQNIYGNVSLGKAIKLLIAVIGQDAALAVAEEKRIPVFQKDLDRMYQEKEKRFSHFRASKENGVIEVSRQFFKMLETKYDFPEIVSSFVICHFFGYYRSSLRALNPYEKPQRKLATTLLNGCLGFLGFKYPDKKRIPINISKTAVLRLLTDTYDGVFNELINRTSKNDSGFYADLPADTTHDFKQAIQRSRKTNSNMTWKIFKPLIDCIYAKEEKEIVRRLLGLYLLKNAESALEEICGISKKEQYQIKEELKRWAKDELPAEPQNETQAVLLTSGHYDPTDFSLLQECFIDPDYQEQKKAIEKCRRYLYLTQESINPSRIEGFITEMEEQCPHCKALFSPWFRARATILASYQFDSDTNEVISNALTDYRRAFEEGRNYAGSYLKEFLEEIIAVSVYFERRETKDIPKVIDSDKSLKTPIANDAKQYYEYGYALNMFEQDSWDTFLLHFRAREHFWKVFPEHLFFHRKPAKEISSADFLKAYGIAPFEGGKEKLEDLDKVITEKLDHITEKTINNRMDKVPGYKHDIQYTPLSIALQMGKLDIAERYLKDFKDSLDVTVINTHGSTALAEALTQYRLCRFRENHVQHSLPKTERYKKSIMELIKRSPADSLYAETRRSSISVLEEAIKSFDLEIVTAIVETKGFDIQNLLISADELSPVYYTTVRCRVISDLLSKGKLDFGNGNINWAKLNVPGIFQEDKMLIFAKLQLEMMNAAKELKETQEMFLYAGDVGEPSIWKEELSDLKKIALYLIEKTEDVEKFVTKGNAACTALSFAAECNFPDICRALIQKGANPARMFLRDGILADSPLFRAMWYRSVDIIRLLLTEYKDRIKPILNERYRYELITVAHLLFYKRDANQMHIIPSPVVEDFPFIESMVSLLRDAGADFNIPDFQGITVRKILKENNIDYLL